MIPGIRLKHMNSHILNYASWGDIKDTSYKVAVLPWGATEPHNYHLPYGTDTLESRIIGDLSVEKANKRGAKAMLLPEIPLGVQNPGQYDIPFCLHTRPSTQLRILEDIVWSLNRQKIRKLIIINGHGGNEFKSMIRELQPQFPEMFLAVIDWLGTEMVKQIFDNPGDHAGEMETSIMLHYLPELVLPMEKAGNGKSAEFKINGLMEKLAWIPRDWSKASEDTGIGNPANGSAEKGQAFVEALTDEVAGFIADISKAGNNDLYEG